MKAPLIRLNFNGGELSPFLDARIDFPKYSSGCKEMTNFVPTVYGPMTKRPGTRFVEDLGEEAVLYPFEFSEDQAYIFAFKGSEIAIYTGDGRLIDGVTPVAIPAYYTLEQAKELKFAQIGDLIYFTHPVGGIYKISRTAVDTFVGEQFEPLNGPFQDENTDENLTLTVVDAGGGDVTITASSSLFVAEDVGASIQIGYVPATEFTEWQTSSGTYALNDYLQYDGRIYQITSGSGTTGTRAPLHERGTKSDGKLELTYISNGYGYAKITTYTSSTAVTAEVIKDFPPNIVGGAATDEWFWSAYGGRFGWPSAIVFHQQRMVLGGSLEQPQTIWGSVQGDIENFQEGTEDDESYEFTIAANKNNPMKWLVSNIILEAGTLGGEFTISSVGSSVTPTDVNIQQIGQYGSSSVAPLIANGFTVFVQSSNRKMRELRFDEDSQRNYARDLNKVAEHIADAGIDQMVYQAEPYQVIWVVIAGELYALTYETDEDVFAWSRQDCGEVLSIATIPKSGSDRLWLVVKRDSNYYIEFLTDFYRRTNQIDDACFVDSSLQYEGSEIQTITGLDHLEGRTVKILNNGSIEPDNVVSGGRVELQFPTTKCVVGLPVESAWQSLRLEGGSNDGLGQGKSKRISNIIFRLEDTGAGFVYGKGTTDKEFSSFKTELPIRSTTDNMDEPPRLYNGDTYRQPIDGGSDTQYMLRIEHNEPVPCTVIAVILTQDTAQ